MTAEPLEGLIRAASVLIGAAGAIHLAWRGRSEREPDLSDVGGTPAKVASVIIAVLLAVMIYDDGKSLGFPPPPRLVFWFLALAVAGLLAYIFLVGVFGFRKEVPVSETATRKIQIIGGLWLTPRARALSRDGITVQTLLKRAGNDPDLVWPRLALGFAQLLVVVSYIVLMVGTSAALALGALIFQRSLAGP